ncbi:MAG: GntR family transcriptional regulator [Zetaproteobacteria bacterium CG2_30_46_52]|nr:MAG: GntR family transcriptional regulator [Zetaproteobacteria bacterium CG2_30_46_52]
MIQIGKTNPLTIVKEVDFGLYLDGENFGEILLPIRYVPAAYTIGEKLEVFLYFDSEDRLIATTLTPLAQVGEFAFLNCVAVNQAGAFLDWGLPKDLLLPYDEQTYRPEVGKSYIVYIYKDESSGRIAASTKIRDFVDEESLGEFTVGQEVELLNANKTDLGYQMIVNNTHLALLHKHEVLQPLKHGERLKGFIQNIRPDRKIDLCLFKQASDKTDEVGEAILYKLKTNKGFLPLHDKSDPEAIKAMFGVSKKIFKKTIGSLYKQKRITIEENGIRLIQIAT